ncbi:hypothetical protein [uncultured Methanolobus sp.]|uniref:hypothetical protein n=1 Tax=uncultured Methanolobus sp. TaxID=218300 RepID=UPI0029C61D70|nr:hypothetical protein [uncultured Methanolobus sp.]
MDFSFLSCFLFRCSFIFICTQTQIIISRDKTNLDILWLKDKSLTDLDNLPDPDILANEIIENIEASLESFREVMRIVNENGNSE